MKVACCDAANSDGYVVLCQHYIEQEWIVLYIMSSNSTVYIRVVHNIYVVIHESNGKCEHLPS